MVNQCSHNQFTCDNICLDLSRKCDKIRDCLDRSDEENCGFSSPVLSDFDRMAQLGLFIGIGVIAIVLIIVLVVAVVLYIRRKKRQDHASVEVIQVPSQYIKTRDTHSLVGSTTSVPTTCTNTYRAGVGAQQHQQQQLTSVDGPYYGMDGDPAAALATASSSASSSNAARSHRSSRRSTRSRRSTSSGGGRSRHVPHNVSGGNGNVNGFVAQPSSAFAAMSRCDSGMATGSTTVSTSAAFGVGRPTSMHYSLHHGRREVAPSIPAAFRHSFHGNLDDIQLRQQQQQQQYQNQQQQQLPPQQHQFTADYGVNLQSGSTPPIPVVNTTNPTAAAASLLDTSPPPPYSTFDRTVITGRFDITGSDESNNNTSAIVLAQQQQQYQFSSSSPSTPLNNPQEMIAGGVGYSNVYSNQRVPGGVVDQIGIRNSANSAAMLRVERNILYGDSAVLSPAIHPSHQQTPLQQRFESSPANAIERRVEPPAVDSRHLRSPSADYTRMWIERVASTNNNDSAYPAPYINNANGNNNFSAPQPVVPSPLRVGEDTLTNEQQSYAQQIRQALRRNQSGRNQNGSIDNFANHGVFNEPPQFGSPVNQHPQQNAHVGGGGYQTPNRTPQSMTTTSGYDISNVMMNLSSSTPFAVTPSPTRCDIPPQPQPQQPQSYIINTRPSYHAPTAIIAKRPVALNV